MALDITNYNYRMETSGQVSLRRKEVTLGDGYSHRTADGINPDVTTWNPTFLLESYATAKNLIADLKKNAGDIAIWQSQLDDAPRPYVIDQFNVDILSDRWCEVSVQLRQWYGG